MSAGRNLRPESTSYKETGIPCGNPARYKSRGVIRMNTGDGTPFKDQRDDQPGEGTESEAEQQLKRMVQNQLDTNITMESQKTKQKVFTSSSKYRGINPESSGTLSLKDYRSLEDRSKYIEQLEQCGLTDEEVQLKLEHEGFLPKASKKSRYGANPEAETQRLEQLQQKIKEKEKHLAKPDSFSNVQHLSRHAMEVELSLNKGTEKADSLKHLVQLSAVQGNSNNGPLMQTLLEDKLSSRQQFKSEPMLTTQSEENPTSSTSEPNSNNTPSSKDTSNAKFMKTSEDGRLCLQTYVPGIPEEEILENKLTVDSIREIPRFIDYQPGEPSKTLYIKNLSHKAIEEDLVSLFARYQHEDGPKVIYRLLKGRMKGQAFVTFQDTQTATKALNLVNGYLLKGKPLIIQYGRVGLEAKPQIHRKTSP